jgi:hypothetical protein
MGSDAQAPTAASEQSLGEGGRPVLSRERDPHPLANALRPLPPRAEGEEGSLLSSFAVSGSARLLPVLTRSSGADRPRSGRSAPGIDIRPQKAPRQEGIQGLEPTPPGRRPPRHTNSRGIIIARDPGIRHGASPVRTTRACPVRVTRSYPITRVIGDGAFVLLGRAAVSRPVGENLLRLDI